MATTEDEWERLFRQRLEEYESEPDEKALERILGHVNVPVAQKPGGKAGRQLGWSVAALSLVGVLTVGVWHYQTASTNELMTASVVAKSESNAKTAEAVGRAAGGATEKVVGQGTAPANQPGFNRSSGREVAQQLTSAGSRRFLNGPSADDALRKPDLPDQQLTATRQPGFETSQPEPINTVYEPSTEIYAINTFTNSTSNLIEKADLAGAQLDFNPISLKKNRISAPLAFLPAVNLMTNAQKPAVERENRTARPSFFASVMPLYTFKAVTPSRQDDVVMEKIRPANSLASRTGWRIQTGAEWSLSRTFSLRVGAVYQQLQQQLTYTARALRSDSSKIEWVDNQTIKLTPLYKSQECRVNTTWQYVAVSAEGRLRLNPGQIGMRHYLSAGGSLGYLISGHSQQNWQPFLQASYGIERRLTNQLRLQIEPGIVYNLSEMSDKSQNFSVRPYSYGLIVGLRWQPD